MREGEYDASLRAFAIDATGLNVAARARVSVGARAKASPAARKPLAAKKRPTKGRRK
jgi:hypothetical protein